MDSWDSEISEVRFKAITATKNTKLYGEDKEEDVMNSWDQVAGEEEREPKLLIKFAL